MSSVQDPRPAISLPRAASRDPRPFPRAALPIAVAAIALVCGFGAYLLIGGSGPTPVDDWWLSVTTIDASSPAAALARFLAIVGGSTGVIILGAVLIVLLWVFRQRRSALMLATALLLGVAMSEVLKRIFERARPGDQLFPTTGFSYPSGHSMGAATLAISLAIIVTCFIGASRSVLAVTWFVAGAWVVLMMWSRAALHAHWLTDTLGGMLLGFAAALLAGWLWSDSGVLGRRNMVEG
ncbi:phosphatase PAP2 family protein [Leucobacter sp. cx-328]|uniref:phosphatase PAP2 family protein n=1 Tax=unclassified Leucobacter TaxID=2621730 RepID=UPI00165E6097|nr:MULTISPECIES: phosphatase PAP2 family protein [unclassified Leucobacter]MBC9944314.1 phosphatase PAP2 family protein [Leucobacter sp. cx-328]